ncbi:MAG: D-alanyl-D-alanine carboxypeptidase/D-alanyl-D-alanine-endopeptidase [Vicinamibacterales bacterium]
MTDRRGRVRWHAGVLSALLLTGCAAHARPGSSPGAPARPTAAVRRLQASVEAVVNAPALSAGTWGILVRSLRSGENLAAINPRKLLTPASTLKVVTLAAAAETLGWNYTYETRVLGLGAIDYGFLDGDLIVAGTGDPSLSEEDGSAQAAFSEWARRLKTAGVQSLSGRVIGDDDAFDDEGLGPGWMWDDLGQGYAAGIGALQVNRDAVRLTVTPAPAPGAPATLELSTESAGLTLRNRVVTTGPGEAARIRTRRPTGGGVLEVWGTVPVDGMPLQRMLAVDNPTQYFVAELRRALMAGGIDIRGPAVDIDAIDQPVRVQDAVPLVVHRSPALSELAGTLMRLSQNQYAETLVKTLGTQGGDPSFDGGRRVIAGRLASWGIPASDVVLADGSGLSRYNLITPAALVSVLSHVDADPALRGPFQAALPVAGGEGTLADRFLGTAAAGLVRAKTGSMTNVRAMAGYTQTAEGEPVAFAILANNYGVPGAEIDRAIDAILLQVVAFRR